MLTWRFVRGPAGTLATRSWGEGELVILVGGGPGLGCAYLFPLAELVAELGFRAVCVQGRGIAPSAWPAPPTFSPEDMADDMVAVQQAYGAERAHWLVHSFGGHVAWAALRASHDLASVCFVNACPPTATANRRCTQRLQRCIAETRPHRQLVVSATDFATELERDWPAYVHDPAEPFPLALVATSFDAAVRTAVASEHRRRGAGPREKLRTNVRAAVLVGESDPFGIDAADAICGALHATNTMREVVPEVGHFPWLERGASHFAAALERALSCCSP